MWIKLKVKIKITIYYICELEKLMSHLACRPERKERELEPEVSHMDRSEKGKRALCRVDWTMVGARTCRGIDKNKRSG